MRILDKEQLLRIMDISCVSDEELINFSYRLCIDLEILIMTDNDSDIRRWATEKLAMIKNYFDYSEEYNGEYIDKKIHCSNNCCRVIDDSISNGNNIFNIDPPTDCIYGKSLAIQRLLLRDNFSHSFNEKDAMKLIKLCESLIVEDQDNLYYENIYKEMKKLILERCEMEYSIFGKQIEENNSIISELRMSIDDLRRE